ncbi:hypothetical protein MUK42_15959 [Musa troglodytarum]|uniref:Uncharacterized protein n=1 Tax=Musa troglodytarum TaxID=320322 RepID=A0A9E7H5B8_9LILI|nr:hypothetical protein MUK42_15959 [Musa troglodytarum]
MLSAAYMSISTKTILIKRFEGVRYCQCLCDVWTHLILRQSNIYICIVYLICWNVCHCSFSPVIWEKK